MLYHPFMLSWDIQLQRTKRGPFTKHMPSGWYLVLNMDNNGGRRDVGEGVAEPVEESKEESAWNCYVLTSTLNPTALEFH